MSDRSLPLLRRAGLAAKAAVGIFTGNPATAQQLLMTLAPRRGEAPRRGTPEYLQAYSTMPWLRATLGKVTNDLAAVSWHVYAVKGAAGSGKRFRKDVRLLHTTDYAARRTLLKRYQKSGELVELDDHPLLGALYTHPYFASPSTVRKLMGLYGDLVGEFFFLKERNALGAPVALWPLPPHWVIRTPRPDYPFYDIVVGIQAQRIPETEVIWATDADPFNPYGRGRGTAQAMGDELDTDEYAAKHTKSHFFNRAQPDFVAWPKPDVGGQRPGRADLVRLQTEWMSQFRGFMRAFKPHFTTMPLEIHEFQQNFKQQQLLELRGFHRDLFMQIIGIPPEIMGKVSDSNRATITQADFIYARHVLDPRLTFQREVFQHRLVPEYDERLILDYDSPIREDRDFQLDVIKAQPGAFQADEIRALADFDPLPDDTGTGHFVPVNVSYEAELLPSEAAPAGGDGAGGKDVALGGAVAKALDDPESVLHRLADKLEPKFRRAFLAAVEAQKASVDLAALERAIQQHDEPAIEAALGLDVLRAELGRADTINALLRQLVAAAGEAAASELNGKLGLELRFDLLNHHSVAWIQQYAGEQITQITDATRDGIRATMQHAFEAGLHPTQTARLIVPQIGLTERQANRLAAFRAGLLEQGVAEDTVAARTARFSAALLRERAITIARTETIDAANAGQELLWLHAQQQGHLRREAWRKEWLVTQDDRLDAQVCFPGKTQVLTADGWKPIRAVRHGELVLTHRDRFRRVVGTSNHLHRGMSVRIAFGGRAYISATPTYGHRILTKRGWVKAEHLTLDDVIAVNGVPCERCGTPIPAGPSGTRRFCADCQSAKRADANAKRWSDPAAHEQLRRQNQERWADPEAHAAMSRAMTGRKHSEATLAKIRAARGARPRKPKVRVRTVAEWGASPEHPFRCGKGGAGNPKAAARLVAWRRSRSPAERQAIERRAAHRGHVEQGRRNRGGSRLERQMGRFLEKQGISFERQWPFTYELDGRERLGLADFYLPGPDIVIECDGYYHSLPDVQRRDAAKDVALDHAGVRVLRFSGEQIRHHFEEVASEVRAHCCIVWLKPKRLEHHAVRCIRVYDLTVEEDHSFVAGGIVAHNCEPMPYLPANQHVRIGESFTTGDGRKIRRPTAHPRCFPVGTIVSAHHVEGVTCRSYDGPLVRIRTDLGDDLAGTPNHPVLTDRGWVPLGEVVPGDRVVRSRIQPAVSAVVTKYDEDVPTRIEEIAEAFRRAGGVAPVEVEVAAEDFHGDGRGSQVAVVWAHRLLGNRVESSLPQQRRELALNRARMEHPALAGQRRPSYPGERLALSAHRVMGSGGHRAALRGREASHAEAIRFAERANREAECSQVALDTAPGDAEVLRYAEYRLARRVTFAQVVRIEVDSSYHGDVLNLQTASGIYVAGGLVVHNCRCAMRLVPDA